MDSKILFQYFTALNGFTGDSSLAGKGKRQDTCYSAAYISQDSQPAALYNLGSGSWLAWASGAAVHYVAIYCPC